jgi:four helix bundle protein
MKKIESFRDLIAWQEGINLVLLIYKLTKVFPRDELFGLVSQMRRCAVSITSNIAEGFSRRNKKEKKQFYYIALGSTTELHNQVIISHKLGYISDTEFHELEDKITLIHKLLNGLIRTSETYA